MCVSCDALGVQGGGGGDRKSTGSLFGRLGSLKKTKKAPLQETKTFLVQYLGSQAVSKVDGLDTVRPVVQVCSDVHSSVSSTTTHSLHHMTGAGDHSTYDHTSHSGV